MLQMSLFLFSSSQPLKCHHLTPNQRQASETESKSNQTSKTQVRRERDFLSKMIQSSVIIAVTMIWFNSSYFPICCVCLCVQCVPEHTLAIYIYIYVHKPDLMAPPLIQKILVLLLSGGRSIQNLKVGIP